MSVSCITKLVIIVLEEEGKGEMEEKKRIKRERLRRKDNGKNGKYRAGVFNVSGKLIIGKDGQTV